MIILDVTKINMSLKARHKVQSHTIGKILEYMKSFWVKFGKYDTSLTEKRACRLRKV